MVHSYYTKKCVSAFIVVKGIFHKILFQKLEGIFFLQKCSKNPLKLPKNSLKNNKAQIFNIAQNTTPFPRNYFH